MRLLSFFSGEAGEGFLNWLLRRSSKVLPPRSKPEKSLEASNHKARILHEAGQFFFLVLFLLLINYSMNQKQHSLPLHSGFECARRATDTFGVVIPPILLAFDYIIIHQFQLPLQSFFKTSHAFHTGLLYLWHYSQNCGAFSKSAASGLKGLGTWPG